MRGVATDQYRAFYGVPFAAPPIGKLRWAPPAPAASWAPRSRTRRRTRTYPQEGLRRHDWHLALGGLSVPERLHAGFDGVLSAHYGVGSRRRVPGRRPHEARLNGTWDAALDADLVVVTVSYRLNIFGFLASDALRHKDPKNGTGNYGIQDQRGRWRGSSGTSRLLAASGPRAPRRRERRRERAQSPRASRFVALLLARRDRVGRLHFGARLARLRRVQLLGGLYDELLHYANCSSLAPGGAARFRVFSIEEKQAQTYKPGRSYEPVVDGVDLTAQLADLSSRGACDRRRRCSSARLARISASSTARNASPTSARSPISASGSRRRSSSRRSTRMRWRRSTRRPRGAARRQLLEVVLGDRARRRRLDDDLSGATDGAAGGHTDTSWLYLFSHVPDGPSGAYPHLAHHASEIPFVFHDKTATGPGADKFHISAREVELSATMARFWMERAASGDPGVVWPPYAVPGGGGGARWLVIGDESVDIGDADLKKEACDFWDAQKGRAARVMVA